jgi:hypothetical protein
MWHDYFKKGNIYCIDNCKKEKCSNTTICSEETLIKLTNHSNRIFPLYCDQIDGNTILDKYKNIKFNIIVDDASHWQPETLKSLGLLFQKVESGGIYVIEDVCTLWHFKTGSWWGQKHSKEFTNAGNNEWIDMYKKEGKLKEDDLFDDTIYYVLENYIKTNVFYSEYLSKEQNDFLTETIDSIEIISAPGERQPYLHNQFNIPKWEGSKNTKLKAGCIAIIKKK